jgi:hypothetical protein
MMDNPAVGDISDRRLTRGRRLCRRIVIACLAAVAASACSRGPDIAVMNRGTAAITDVRFEYSGGSASVGTLAAGETKEWRVSSSGQSPLTLRFRDPSGRPREQLIDVYFEAGYRGKLTVWIDSDFRVTWQGTLRP